MKTLRVLLPLPGSCVFAQAQTKPNVVYILADDLGYVDLSCNGRKEFKTPDIDLLAKEDLLSTDHYSGNTVCSPSRTGRMPQGW